MKKIKFLFIALVLVLSLNCVANVIYAAQEDNTDNVEDTKVDDEKEKQDILTLIEECLDTIEVKLNNIDKEIENAKKQEEFEYYPAIRLNMDTPMFGITSLVENKIRVKKDISTSDVASKYSIRDIVKDKKIKLPESAIGAIVVSTKEYKIDSTMTLPQLKLTLVKCIQYLSQVNSAEEFIENQINKTFKDYISDSKKVSIKEIKDRNTKLQKNLVEISDKLNILAFLGVDINTYKSEYSTISKELYSIGQKVKNALILDEDLTELNKNSLNTEVKAIELQSNVTKAYDEAIKNADYEVFLNNVYNRIKARTDRIDKYVENSTTQVNEVVDGKEEEKTEVNYDVTSMATLDYMEITIKELETTIEDYKEELANESDKNQVNVDNQENTQEPEEKTDEDKEAEENARIEDNKRKIDEVYSKYKEVLSREYRFYINNINMLLKDSNDKVSSMIAEIDSGIEIDNEIFNYTKYIYIDLPYNLTSYINQNNLNSMLEMNNLINQLIEELNNLSTTNNRITKMYNDMITEILKS